MLFGVLFLLATSPILLAQESDNSTETESVCKNDTYTGEAATALDHIYSSIKCLDKKLIQYATELSRKSNRLDRKEAWEKCIQPIELPEVTALRAKCLNATQYVMKYDTNAKTIDMVCFSLRLPPSDSCKQAKQKALDGIKQAAYDKEIQLQYNKTLTALESNFQKCFENYGKYEYGN